MAPSDDYGSGDPRASSVHSESDERGARYASETGRFHENIERLRKRWRGRKQGLKDLFDSDERRGEDNR